MAFLPKQRRAAIGLLAVAVLAFAVLFIAGLMRLSPPGQTDDWQYSASSYATGPDYMFLQDWAHGFVSFVSNNLTDLPIPANLLILAVVGLVLLVFLVEAVAGLIRWIRAKGQIEKRDRGKLMIIQSLPILLMVLTAAGLGSLADYATYTLRNYFGELWIITVFLIVILLVGAFPLYVLIRAGLRLLISPKPHLGRKHGVTSLALALFVHGPIVFVLSVVVFAHLVYLLTSPSGTIQASRYASYGYSVPTASPGQVDLGLSYATETGLAPTGGSFFSAPSADRTIGYSVGGAKDINNFRVNIKNGYLPLPTDITYEGLFYDYFFDTGRQQPCTKLFCPSYSSAVSPDPFSDEEEYYLSVGLNSGIKESDFQRKKLNLIVVLDISGSMGSPFSEYYYDSLGGQRTGSGLTKEERADANKSKMEIATESVAALLDHLNPDDSFGMVLFDDDAYLAKPLNSVDVTDIKAIKDHILDLEPMGGTNMEAGIAMASDLFKEYADFDRSEYENRMIFLTDAMPNTGRTDETSLLGQTQANADNGIYTTFVGIGVDFNTELIEATTKIRGANYYSVHSGTEFRKRMDDQFDYMVTPLVFDLQLTIDAPGFEIQKVYGSPEADEATGQIMKVNTLFPSESTGAETRGGLVLLRMRRLGGSSDSTVKLTASYENRLGQTDSSTATIQLTGNGVRYDNNGIRKGIALARYANVMRNWTLEEREGLDQSSATTLSDASIAATPDYPEGPESYGRYGEQGIPIFDRQIKLGQWERQSASLSLSPPYPQIMERLRSYLAEEIQAIGDETMKQELDLLDYLLEEFPLTR